MASGGLAEPWYVANPALVEEIERDLRAHYPTLRLDLSEGRAEVRGTFPILDEDGTELDRWEVSITLPPAYPTDLPVVRETGGRIPARLENHVLSSDGTACVLLPESRYRWFPLGAPFVDFLDGPLRGFLASQSHRARGGTWVHGEWEHGALAALQFYKELLGSGDDIVGWRALIAVGLDLLDGHLCPCGRRRPVRECHPVLVEVRQNVGTETAQARLIGALAEKVGINSSDEAVRLLLALPREVKGHHPCPCGSGKRVRECHPSLRELGGAFPAPVGERRAGRGKRR